MPKVSIVIPTHNRADLLARALRSALTQTFADLEVIIADDASTDGTGHLVRAMEDRRVKYLRHATNKGVSAARNTAISQATGEYIAFLDDDDEWLPQKLEIQLDHMATANNSVGLMCSGFYTIDCTSDQVASEIVPKERGWMYERLLSEGWSFYYTSTVLARAACFEKVGLFDVAIRYGEDFDLWVRIAKEYELDFVPIPLALRYVQAGGLSQNYEAIISGTEAQLLKYRDFFEKHSYVFSDRLQKLGTLHCFAGDTRRGRQAYYRAIAYRPLSLKSYVCATLSLMGPQAFKSCYAAKQLIT